jgi:phosphatidylglycerophosphate synthase
MKKVNVLQLIASLCLLLGNVINLWNLREGLPFAVCILAVPLLLASIVLYAIVFAKRLKEKKQDKQRREQ